MTPTVRATHTPCVEGRSWIVMPPENRSALNKIDLSACPCLVDARGHVVLLPKEVYQVLQEVVGAMRAGQAMTLAPTDLRLTLGEAAQILGVSRPTVVKLVEEGKIPYVKLNRHRYIMLSDLDKYRSSQAIKRKRILTELTQEATRTQTSDPSVQEVASALAAVRKERVR